MEAKRSDQEVSGIFQHLQLLRKGKKNFQGFSVYHGSFLSEKASFLSGIWQRLGDYTLLQKGFNYSPLKAGRAS